MASFKSQKIGSDIGTPPKTKFTPGNSLYEGANGIKGAFFILEMPYTEVFKCFLIF